MKIVDRHNFIGTASTVFTILVLGKIVVEFITRRDFGSYQGNLITMFVLSFLATFVLSQHYRFDKYPLLFVIIGQYVVLIGGIMLFIWWSGRFEPIHENGYRDMFLSFTIPYLIGVVIYYAAMFHEIRCANEALKEIREKSGEMKKESSRKKNGEEKESDDL